MPDNKMSERQADPAIKWLVRGGLLAMGGGIFFLLFLADELRFIGPTGAGAVLGIGAAACLAFGAVALGPVGRAIGKRILGGGAESAGLEEDLHDLRLQVDDLRNALTESQERLDFTERLLAGDRERTPEELH
jgi:hypothetical protein